MAEEEKSTVQRQIGGVNKLTRLGKKSMAVTLPIELVEKLGWRERQKVKVVKKGSKLIISDWKK